MRTKRHLFNHGKKFSNYEIVCKIEIEIADKNQGISTKEKQKAKNIIEGRQNKIHETRGQ